VSGIDLRKSRKLKLEDEMESIKFEVGVAYETRSVCDHDRIFKMEVISRTEKTVLVLRQGKPKRFEIHMHSGVEQISLGSYSMAPFFYADRPAKVEAASNCIPFRKVT
jgi:hypothetical protein